MTTRTKAKSTTRLTARPKGTASNATTTRSRRPIDLREPVTNSSRAIADSRITTATNNKGIVTSKGIRDSINKGIATSKETKDSTNIAIRTIEDQGADKATVTRTKGIGIGGNTPTGVHTASNKGNIGKLSTLVTTTASNKGNIGNPSTSVTMTAKNTLPRSGNS